MRFKIVLADILHTSVSHIVMGTTAISHRAKAAKDKLINFIKLHFIQCLTEQGYAVNDLTAVDRQLSN